MRKIRTRPLEELKDKHIGSIGSVERDEYELELNMEVLGDFIKETRNKLEMTQEELGHLVGVQKAQISKLESSVKNTTLTTLMKVFEAMNASVKLNIIVGK